MAGSVGATAFTDMKHLALFGMICRLPDNILHKIATDKLHTESDNQSSWFVNIRHLCVKYSLPSPLFLLANPPPKSSYKSLIKRKIVDFWQGKYRRDASNLPSLQYFKPHFHSLLTHYQIRSSHRLGQAANPPFCG